MRRVSRRLNSTVFHRGTVHFLLLWMEIFQLEACFVVISAPGHVGMHGTTVVAIRDDSCRVEVIFSVFGARAASPPLRGVVELSRSRGALLRPLVH